MKNSYSLSSLERHLEVPIDEVSKIFFKMLDFSNDKQYVLVELSPPVLEDLFSAGEYFVAHHVVRHKGKARFFNGPLCVSQGARVQEFILAAVAANDLRDLILAPVFVDQPSRVIFVGEDFDVFVYE